MTALPWPSWGCRALGPGQGVVVGGDHVVQDAKEEEFVFPPLGLLDQIAAGEMPSDDVKKAAIDMAERTKAARLAPPPGLHRRHLSVSAPEQICSLPGGFDAALMHDDD